MTWQVEQATEPSQAPDTKIRCRLLNGDHRWKNESRFGSEIDR